jgi:hypothetical protein
MPWEERKSFVGVIVSYVELKKRLRDAFFTKHVLARIFNAKTAAPFVGGYRFMVFLNFCSGCRCLGQERLRLLEAVVMDTVWTDPYSRRREVGA